MAKNFKYRLIFIILFIVIIAVIAFLVVKGLKAPSQGSLSQTPLTQAEKTIPYSQPGTYTGKYISFKYPAHYKTSPTKFTGTYIELASYASTDQTFKQINVGVSRGSIKEDSGVSYRRQHPELYHENSSSLGVEFTKSDSTEDTFFVEHNGFLTSVSTTGPGSSAAGETLYIASSLRWR